MNGKRIAHKYACLGNRTACLLVCLASHADALRAPGFGFVTLSCLAIHCQAYARQRRWVAAVRKDEAKEKIKTAGDLLIANARES